MDQIKVRGGLPLAGEVVIQGSKNGTLPLMAASVLIDGKVTLHNCPSITDVTAMQSLLNQLGCQIERLGHTLKIDASSLKNTLCDRSQVEAMRSSFMLAGPLLARFGQVEIYYPGGCVIGERPVDLHIQVFRAFGASCKCKGDVLSIEAAKLEATHFVFPVSSVGASENAIMVAVLTEGKTILENVALEPEVTLLCKFLTMAGAKIQGIGSRTLKIEGVQSLKETHMTVVPDRIVAGTYLLAAAATRGQIVLRNTPTKQLAAVIDALGLMGARVYTDDDMIVIDAEEAFHNIAYLPTAIYPGFPTDLQSALLVTLCLARGSSVIEEKIFENRFRIVPELKKMGADIKIENNHVKIYGVNRLYKSTVRAYELRGGAALIIAGLCARGETTVLGKEYIDRGYEDICRDFRMLSAAVTTQHIE